MDQQLKKDSLELLTKESERYRLERLGFFRDIREEAELLASRFPPKEDETFAQWKSRCLREYYRHKGFSAFCRDNIDTPGFEMLVRTLINTHLQNVFNSSPRTETDRFLAPDLDTVSYAMPQSLFQELYTIYFSAMPSFGNTSELNRFCGNIAGERFPVDESRIIGSMQENDSFYWEKFYAKLRPIADAFSYQMSGLSGNDSTHDLWSDTCISVNRAVVERRLKEPVDARAVISYSVGTIKNKNKELLRNRAKAPVDVDSLQYKLTIEEEERYFNNPVTKPENFPSQIPSLRNYIDYTDKDSIQGYFIVILYNKEHPLHDELVKGYEDKIERMFEHYIDGLSYEEIVARHSGVTDDRETAKECARLRQETKRLKKNLLDRFHKMMEKYR